MGKGRSYVRSDFYCPNCGKSVSIQRRKGYQRASGHRKKMYCPWCRNTLNMIECKTQDDIEEFKERFFAGEFAEEVKASIEFCEKENFYGVGHF